MVYSEFKILFGVKILKKVIWNGSKDLPYLGKTDKFLHINGCDITRTEYLIGDPFIIDRKKGRPDYYLLYVISGKVQVSFNDTEYTAYAGDVIFFPPHTPQKIIYEKKNKPYCYWIHFLGYAAKDMLATCGIIAGGIYHIGKSPAIEDTFVQFMLAFRNQKSDAYKNYLFSQLMMFFEGTNKAQVPTFENSAAGAKILKGFMELEYEYPNSRKIAEYAKMSNLSQGHFEALFKRATGNTPHKHIENTRIKKSCELLEKSFLSVSEISRSIGYNDPLYFSKVFKKHTGVSPTEYRKNLKSTEG